MLKYRNTEIVLASTMGVTEATSIALNYSPERFNEPIKTFRRNCNQMPEMLGEQKLNETNTQRFLETIDWEEQNRLHLIFLPTKHYKSK